MKNAGYKKDYSKLRPFDLEAAKSGEAMCDQWGDNEYIMFDFITRYSTGDVHLSVRHVDSGFEYHHTQPCDLRMKPLAWVEGLPVYKGDVLYRPGINSGPVVVESADGEFLRFADRAGSEFPDNFTWHKPKQKVKRKIWINVYSDYTYSFQDWHSASRAATSGRIACVETEIEYEV